MRRFIRHPSDIPISYTVGSAIGYSHRLKDVGVGGLCFRSNHPIPIGSQIKIEIKLEDMDFSAQGTVVWSRPEGDVYSVGVEFCDKSTKYGIRMIEQVCHIEHYRSQVLSTEGRRINSEQAAKEWVEKYAAEFPAA